ncbi:MAG: ribonuclease III domain-containing protein [Thomasclavelia sp.]|nr:ribonuclease III domain-containing protein [Thomasclavelia sp.]
MNPDFINPLVLAYLGDSVLELLVREYLVKDSGLAKTKDMQKLAIDYVCAPSHMAFMMYALENNLLTQTEIDTYKRGRNTKNTKTETKEHRHSTGFEAIIGSLYLLDDKKRIKEIFAEYQKFIKSDTNMGRN